MSEQYKWLWLGLAAALSMGCETDRAASSGAPSSEPPSTLASPRGPLTLVSDPSLVCMVNDQFMGRTQIPVQVNGSTYYGCCPMCKDRLTNDPSTRTAIDPLSRKSIGKASAVIAKTENGTTLYFESPETLTAYSRNAAAN